VTREAIADRLAALREAGAKLRRRPARETLAALARVVDGWSDPDSPWRRALESELPAVTGFSPPVVREGAQRGFEGWSGRALCELAARELGPPELLDQPSREMVSGFDTTALLLAGQIPMPTLLAVIAPLVLRSPVLLRPSSRDPVTPRLVARSVAETDAELGQSLELVAFDRSDQACTRALLEADCVVASGSDATMAAVSAMVQAPRRLVTYGHRLSVAALGAAATQGPELADAADRIALDVALWDQLGCLSPIAVYVAHPDSSAADRVAAALAQALEQIQQRLPRGQVGADAAAAIAHERAQAEMSAAAGRRVTLLTGARLAWTVVREDGSAPLPAPLHRFLRVHPLKDPAALVEALRPLGPHLAAVAIEGFAAEAPALARALADLGASRVCRPGTLQSPPLAWRHDNRGVLAPLARFANLEAPPP